MKVVVTSSAALLEAGRETCPRWSCGAKFEGGELGLSWTFWTLPKSARAGTFVL
jgi:hypothetical protein